ncbi:MAG: polyamine aminopropyltransferase [Candidatus Thiodiazotropha sp. (ex Dulcina madagascariensis)]|nr:polyamine aminopropyltransferase [Candidatus Thiodiazotropha sp. (ex Dulcina madagascariensis)]MCU7928196.1 polyamine aminopropyltransferase [Candidatus Thiodiazotropha sp. (ex Dulcina madagascariensis)]
MEATVPSSRRLLGHDALLIGGMLVLAGCGLIYEYLLAHYAGRILGAVESTIYAMIGIMIVAMGIGAFLARWVKCPFTGFAWLEVGIGLLGSCAILLMAGMIALTYTLPVWLQQIYGLHPTITTDGGFIAVLQTLAFYTPFVAGFILGAMIGMEIPLIARVREQIHGRHLAHNTGTIYGADYIGAGIGAAIWVGVCLNIPIMAAAVGTAAANLLIGLIFLWRYQTEIVRPVRLWLVHAGLAMVLVVLAFHGSGLVLRMNYTLFKDTPIYSKVTPYQHITLTRRHVGQGLPSLISLYINGRLQFSSSDENIYHSYLTYPALLASARHDQVLVIGGGDGMAVRDILRWNPKQVTLIDLDAAMIALFKGDDPDLPATIEQTLLDFNRNAFNDPRVSIIIGDAFIEVEKLVSEGRHFDTIIIDLPDPSHPDLNKLYTDFFYARLKELLSGDGAIAVQSTSPYHAKKAFVSIGKTMRSAGFLSEQYHTNVPTFGEWGWTIGTVRGLTPSQRIAQADKLPVADSWLSKAALEAAFIFAPSYFEGTENIEINRLGSHQIYRYHHEAWSKNNGVFFAQMKN